jgi:hypothetical protein
MNNLAALSAALIPSLPATLVLEIGSALWIFRR